MYKKEWKQKHKAKQESQRDVDVNKLKAERLQNNRSVETIRLMQLIESLASDPRDTVLNIAAAAAARRRTDNQRKHKSMIKASISSPCWFSHVTQLDRAGADSILSFSTTAHFCKFVS